MSGAMRGLLKWFVHLVFILLSEITVMYLVPDTSDDSQFDVPILLRLDANYPNNSYALAN